MTQETTKPVQPAFLPSTLVHCFFQVVPGRMLVPTLYSLTSLFSHVQTFTPSRSITHSINGKQLPLPISNKSTTLNINFAKRSWKELSICIFYSLEKSAPSSYLNNVPLSAPDNSPSPRHAADMESTYLYTTWGTECLKDYFKSDQNWYPTISFFIFNITHTYSTTR